MFSKRLYVPALAALLALGSTACEKDPETEPRYLIRDELEWDEKDRNATVALFFFNDIFTYLPGGFNRVSDDFLDAGTDDAMPSRLNRPAQYFTNGAISVVNSPDQYWGTAYAGIRRVNIFLANIDRVPALPANIALWKAEVRFIRAMLYFELVKRYGGVPLVGDRLYTLDDNLALPRNTYAESVSYIVSECDAIKGTLRLPAAIPDGEWGRIPSTAALALKARLLLYAASPLYNGGQVNGAGDRQGYPSYDAGRWQTALAATQELMPTATPPHSLLATPATPAGAAFASVFTTKKNPEIILAKQSANSTNLETYNAPIGYSAPATSNGNTSPSQNFVDAFPTLTGLPIAAAGSGYDANNPYANRDPRLLYSVFANGTTVGTTTTGSRWLSRNVETFEGGRDKPNTTAVQTRTGYYLRKFLGDFTGGTTYSNTSHNFPLFRYAEVLLNAAECLNEVGRTSEALTMLVPLRQRAGLTAGTGSRYGIPAALSQADARALIRNERRIELGFEEHRFWDVRRWKTAETVLNGPLYGMQITRAGAGTTAAPYTYAYNPRTPAATLVWQTRLYYLPLPYDETTKNLNLTQNPGW